MTTISSNKEALAVSATTQQKTKDVLSRIQADLTQTELQGATTLEELYEQRRKLEGIQGEADRLHDQLDQTDKLQRKLGTWFGGMGRKKKFNRTKPDELQKENNQQESQQEQPTNSDKKKWRPFRKSSTRKSTSSTKEDPFPELIAQKGLLGDNNVDGEHGEELQALAKGDEEIDAQLDAIGNQLGDIVRLSQQIGSETNTHNRMIQTVDTQLSEAETRQKKANKKTKRLLR